MNGSVIGMAHATVFEGDDLREERDVSPAKTQDASKLSLPIGWVAAIVLALGGFGINQALGMSNLQSDVRDMKQMIIKQGEVFDLKLMIQKLEMEKGELRKALLAELKP